MISSGLEVLAAKDRRMLSMNWKITLPLSLVKRSMKNSLAFVGTAETVMAITGISLADLLSASANWLKRLLLFIIVFLVFSFLIEIILCTMCRCV